MTSLNDFDLDKKWDYENGFYLTSDPARMGKLLAHFELYREIVGLAGHVVELGVYKGASLMRFATFRNLLEAESSRRVVAFDAFGLFPRDELSDDDSGFVDRFEEAGGNGLSADDVRRALDQKGLGNVELVEGNVFDTLPAYLEQHPELRIALLHLDMDVKGPTALALELLFSRVVPGGLIVIDDYSTVAGATDAVDEFFAGVDHRIEKLSVSHVPCFVRKAVN